MVITISDSVIDIAKDFTALMIIADFDNIFGSLGGGQEKAISIISDPMYDELFTVEVTTSKDAQGEGNSEMKEDPVIEKINKRRAKLRQKMEERLRATEYPNMEDYKRYKAPVKRWTMVGIHNGMRTPSNNVLFKIYKAIRRFHVSVWFYPFPFIVMIVMFNGAFMNAIN